MDDDLKEIAWTIGTLDFGDQWAIANYDGEVIARLPQAGAGSYTGAEFAAWIATEIATSESDACGYGLVERAQTFQRMAELLMMEARKIASPAELAETAHGAV